MIYFLKKYPLSLLVIALVLFLSFFRPPSIPAEQIPGMDKLVHCLMYAAMSGMLWREFLRAHRDGQIPFYKAWIGALICPAVLGGVVEILQGTLTNYRGGDWMDFVADICGVLLATWFAWFYLLRLQRKKS
jgi:VanZ family protein